MKIPTENFPALRELWPYFGHGTRLLKNNVP